MGGGGREGVGETIPDDLKAGDAVLVVLRVRFQVLNVDVGQACNTPLRFLTFNTFI
jgi:hypothetical protein